jgi:hypothetical protein
MAAAAASAHPGELEAELQRTERALAHLERSNTELRDAMAAGDADPEYKRAVEDNSACCWGGGCGGGEGA